MSKTIRYLIGVVFGVGISLLAWIAFLTVEGWVNSDNETLSYDNSETGHISESGQEGASYSRSDLGKDLSELTQYQSDFARSVALYALLEQSDRAELIDLAKRSATIDHSSRRRTTQVAIGRKIAAVSTHLALEVAMEVPKSTRAGLLFGAYHEWSTTNLDEAIASAQTLDTASAQIALQAILETRNDLSDSRQREIAGQFGREEFAYRLITEQTAASHADNPRSAWQALMDDNIDNSYQLRELREASLGWVERDGLSVLSNLFSAPTPKLDSDVRSELIRSIVEIDPSAAFNHVEALPSEEKKWLLRSIVRVWARIEPQRALEAAANIEPDSDAKTLLNDVVFSWAKNDPHGILSGIEQFDHELRLEAAEYAISFIAIKDPEEAARIVEELQSKVSNTSSIEHGLIDHWSQSDPRAALDWLLEDSGRGDTRRRSFIEKTLRALAHVDSQYAFQIGLEQPLVGEYNVGLESDVISELSTFDIETALSLLPKVREESKSISYVWVGQALVKKRDPNRAMELGEQVPESRRDYYYGSIAGEWATTNPIQLYEELEQMPGATLRSTMARQLLFNNISSPILTKDQVEHARSLLTEEDASYIDQWEQRQ
ncbi:MAG: hypothetical protein F4X44_00595 [Gammaproteobacteria bacterium]|nr:hypothetical protein [Gammaproteobacteria bacterium]MYD79101.1 hypothetical protein [Gammaproteobacteria bacterium]